MSKFRKKPITIEAVQYLYSDVGDNEIRLSEWPKWIKQAYEYGRIFIIMSSEDYNYLGIKTLEGEMRASPDDWIIKGVKGEIYPCKPDIFEVTYEAV